MLLWRKASHNFSILSENGVPPPQDLNLLRFGSPSKDALSLSAEGYHQLFHLRPVLRSVELPLSAVDAPPVEVAVLLSGGGVVVRGPACRVSVVSRISREPISRRLDEQLR